MFSKNNSGGALSVRTNRIVEETKIVGNISSKADFRLDGHLVGDFFGEGKIVVGPNGSIRGNVLCKSADIEGYYEGKIQVTELLSIKGTATILGEVIVGQLSVEPGAKFSASCVMKGLESNALLSHETETA